MKYNGFYAHMGRPNGIQLKPDPIYKKIYDTVTILPTSGWVEVYPMINNSSSFYSNNTISDFEINNNVLWDFKISRGRFKLQKGKNHDYASNIVKDERIYSSTSTGMVYALNKDDGKKIWSKNLGERTTDLTIFDNKLFVGSNKGIHIINIENGKLLFEKSLKGFVTCKPIVFNNSVLVGCSDGSVYSIDISSHSINWRCSLSGSIYISEVKDDKVFVCSDKTCYAINPTDGIILWGFSTNGPITAPSKVDEDCVYFGSWDNNFYAVNTSNGNLCWKFEMAWGSDSHRL